MSRPEPPDALVDPEHGIRQLVLPLLEAVPEFVPLYRRLDEASGGEPGAVTVLMELADFVLDHGVRLDQEQGLLARVLDAVEKHLERLGDDEEASEIVGFAFFDSMPPECLRSLRPLDPGPEP